MNYNFGLVLPGVQCTGAAVGTSRQRGWLISRGRIKLRVIQGETRALGLRMAQSLEAAIVELRLADQSEGNHKRCSSEYPNWFR